MPEKIGVAVILFLVIANLIGELLELKGKVVPEYVKMRKYFKRKKDEKQQLNQTFKEFKTLLNDVNEHYSKDNITKRNEWIQWVNDRATVYDKSVDELKELKEALMSNNELTLDLYININRNRIIDFASRIVNEDIAVSREQFNRIFKTYSDYEAILDKYKKTNGEVDVAMGIIKESYTNHMKHHTFIEDVRGY